MLEPFVYLMSGKLGGHDIEYFHKATNKNEQTLCSLTYSSTIENKTCTKWSLIRR